MGEEGGGRRGRREKGEGGTITNVMTAEEAEEETEASFLCFSPSPFSPSWAREQQASFFFTSGGERKKKGLSVASRVFPWVGIRRIAVQYTCSNCERSAKMFF